MIVYNNILHYTTKQITIQMIILLIGTIGSGKSTAADYLKTLGFTEYTFAAPLKKIGEAMQFTTRELYGTQADKAAINAFWGISAREFLQQFGTEICRQALPAAIPNMNMNRRTVWARIMEKNIQDAIQHKRNIVISDGRFLDEAALVKEYGGLIIKLERPYAIASNHASETELCSIKADCVIQNTGTIRDLHRNLDKYVGKSSDSNVHRLTRGLQLAWLLVAALAVATYIGVLPTYYHTAHEGL
jgi:dephospho-CoA kinase